MGPPRIVSAPAPALYPVGDRPPVANAYFAVAVDAAIDLHEAREYQELSWQGRVAKARAEQQDFLSKFFDPALGIVLDLRIVANPKTSTPLSAAVLGRVWGSDADEVTARAQSLSTQVHAAMPPHVAASVVEDVAAVGQLLTPFGGTALDSAVITRHESLGLPSRPDAGVSYYYSAAPFNWSDGDWSAVYSALAGSPVPVVLSVAVLPMQVPAHFAQTLLTLATFYGRLARDGESPSGFHLGRQRLPPDDFAVAAEKAFHEYSRRLSHKAFALRIQVSAAKKLPPGIVEAIAGAISPGEQAGSFSSARPRAAGTYDVRRPTSVAERRLAEYNLTVINVGMLTGRAEIWSRPDPPDPQLAMLTVLGDARDAACAFCFPIAADGIVPGFRVRHDRAGRSETVQFAGPTIQVGKLAGTNTDATIPLRSLARHALITGSAGSGKTSTALELLRQLWAEHGVPFLVIEPAHSGADDYRKLAAGPGFDSLEVVTVGDEDGAPLRFNPFEVPSGMLIGEHQANLLACFEVASGLGEPLAGSYRDALSLTYLRCGFLAPERPADGKRDWPTIVEFVAAMSEVTGEAVPASLRRLCRGAVGSVFLTDRPNDFARLLDHPVILELKSLGNGDEQALMMALLLTAVTEHYQSAGGEPTDLVHVTLVEDAHRLLGRGADGNSSADAQARQRAAASFADALAGNHRYGAGMILVERSPAKLVPDAVNNASLRITHQLTAKDDRRLGEAVGMDDVQRLSAARLRTGEVLLYSDAFTEAAQVSIARTVPAQVPPPGVVQPSAGPPFAACDRCRSQCTYRGAVLSMLEDPALVGGITDAAVAISHTGVSRTERAAGLAGLRARLRDTVARFAALPATDPGRSDAGFCLFLHIYASSGLRAMPTWPAVAAGILAITRSEQAEFARGDGLPGAGSAKQAAAPGDDLLRLADELAGQPEQSSH